MKPIVKEADYFNLKHEALSQVTISNNLILAI